MDNIIKFNNEQFGEIRTIEVEGKVLFCGKDVATALGYKDTVNALKQHCKSDGVVNCHPIKDNLGRTQEARFITEGDVYRLITHSKLESAQKFESWVFDEVLPTLRKTGSYTIQQPQKSEKELDILEHQLKIEEARLWREMGLDADTQSKTYKQICNAYASKALEGTFALPLPTTQKTYSAEDIAKELGISAVKVGRIANHYGLKTDEYGCWNKDKAKYDSSKEVDAFRYYENAISVIAEHKEEKISNKK